jgi:hypothetical protein
MKLQLHDKCRYFVFIKIYVSAFDKQMGLSFANVKGKDQLQVCWSKKCNCKVNLTMIVFTLVTCNVDITLNQCIIVISDSVITRHVFTLPVQVVVVWHGAIN